jgi:type I restriction enzyme M protein
VLFLDKNADSKIVLMDASKLGKTVKEGKNQRTVLSREEESQIIEAFNSQVAVEDLSVVVSKDLIQEKNYSLAAGQYFEVKIEYVDITMDEFQEKMSGFEDRLVGMFGEGNRLDINIQNQLKGLRYEGL